MNWLRYRMILGTAGVVVLLDQASKWLIMQRFALYESLPVIPNYFAITYVRNKGAAFGILADARLRLPVLLVVTLVAVALLLWYYRQQPLRRGLSRFALSLLLGGAVGNLIDRMRFGEVIDFLDVYWQRYHWPAFNVADSAITIGVILLLLDRWLLAERLPAPGKDDNTGVT
jgi:signal peptidase II